MSPAKTTENFRFLKLDSEIFGIAVAKILPDRLALDEFDRVMACLRKNGTGLVFWASDPNDAESQQAARLHGGFLADEKVTFLIDLKNPIVGKTDPEWDIRPYTGGNPCAELEELAIQVGNTHSRFKVDPRIPEHVFLTMYKTWIRNSVNGQIADTVLVARHAGRIAGMVTLGVKDGRGDIGLFAVHSGMRGKNLGTSLALAAQDWFYRKGLRSAQVVTQQKNTAACRLYEKCGYRVEKVEFFYHFWLSVND
jgi:dTDP-4-amino-4,6-dideoxy-D-galactose acyltransferase